MVSRVLFRVGHLLSITRVTEISSNVIYKFPSYSTLGNMGTVIPPVTRLSERVIRILGCNPGPMTLQGTNTYLIGTGKNRILLDTGDEDIKAYTDNIENILKQENINISDIIITHWHHDHIGGVKNLYPNIVGECKVWKFKRSLEDSANHDLPSDVPINWLENFQRFDIEGASLMIHHTPGHTTDHVVVTLAEDKVLFSGDCILGEGTAVFEDLFTYMKSLQEILQLKPDVIYPGHGNVINDPIERIEFYISHRNQRENQILAAMKKDVNLYVTEMDLVKTIYTETPENLWPAAALNVNHHLQKLVKENKVKEAEIDGETKWRINQKSLL